MKKLSFVFRTSENRGDHAADINIHFEPKEGETVDQLVERVGLAWPTEVLEIKIIKVEEQNP